MWLRERRAKKSYQEVDNSHPTVFIGVKLPQSRYNRQKYLHEKMHKCRQILVYTTSSAFLTSGKRWHSNYLCSSRKDWWNTWLVNKK